MKNARINTDQRFNLSLKAGGASIDMTSIDVLSLYMYCNPQKARDGAIKHSVSTSDAKVLEMIWPADVQRYLGSHSVHGTIRYAGSVASFDVPAVNVVSKTSEADISTDTIVLEAPVGTEDLTATITIQGMGPQGPKGDKMTYADLTQEDKEDLYEGGASLIKPLLDTKQNVLTDTDGGYGQRVAELETGKQDTLTAGNGISIEGNVISSSVAEVVDNIVNAGYVFAGVATPATDPGTPNAKVFYIANGNGTYTNFGSIEITEDEVVVLKYDTAWHKVATGIASQAKLSELSEEVSLLSVGINGEDIDINALDVVKAFPNNNGDTYVWYIGGSTYLGTFIKIPGGIKLSIKGNASADTSYCFVKEIGKVNGDVVKFATNSTLTRVEWGKTISIVAPEDAAYLWVSMGTRVPQGISIEGSLANVLHVSSIVNNLYSGGSNRVLSAEQGKTLNEKIESIPIKPSEEYNIENIEVVRHYADVGKWIIDYMASEYSGCYIPVKGGDAFTIVGSDTNAIYAFIKSKGTNNGDNVDFAGDATKTTVVSPNIQKVIYAPDDAKFLWVCVKYNNNNRFPTSLIKEGEKIQSIGKWNLHNITENPLEVVNTDGGFARIFKNWGFIGDSMTSGNHNYYNKNGIDVGGDIFEYSWGEYIKQILGCDGYEYSTGGWTCRDWIDATNGRGWDKLQTEKRQVYTIALGCNDASPEISYALGTPSDIKSDYNQNPDTFYGNYAGIIQRIKSIQPKAIIFCITLPSGDRVAAETYNAAIRYMAEKFSNVYIIDLYKYAPPVNEEWGDTFRNRYHLNAMGYLYTAWEILTYIDWIIRKNPLYFRDVAFIGDDNKYVTPDSNVYGNNGL